MYCEFMYCLGHSLGQAYHPDAQSLYRSCLDLETVCTTLLDPSKRLGPELLVRCERS